MEKELSNLTARIFSGISDGSLSYDVFEFFLKKCIDSYRMDLVRYSYDLWCKNEFNLSKMKDNEFYALKEIHAAIKKAYPDVQDYPDSAKWAALKNRR